MGSNATIQHAIEKSLADLPALPTVVTKVIQVTSDNTSSAATVEKLVKADQGISSKLLRVVNSPYFGLSGRVTSVSQAVVILGFQQVRNMVVSLGALSIFEAQSSEGRALLTGCWVQAFASASGAQLIAKRKRLEPRDQELAFVGALLQDLGRLFLVSEFTPQYAKMLSRKGAAESSFAEMERSTFGSDHPAVGAELGRRWRLPDELIAVIAGHEGPFERGVTEPLLLCVNAADRLAHEAVTFEDLGEPVGELDPVVADWLDMDEDDLLSLRSEIAQKTQSGAELMGLAA